MNRRAPLKRGRPLQNKTRLQRKTPLKSTGLVGGARPVDVPGRAPLRRTRLQPVSAQRRSEQPARKAAEAALFQQRPWCWRCGRTDMELHGHEILGRAQGGDPTNPDCLLDDLCNTWCEDNPIEAAWLGWKISRKPHPVMPCIAAGACRPWDHSAANCWLRGAA